MKFLGGNCFRDTKIRTLVIGSGLTEIGKGSGETNGLGSCFGQSSYLERIIVSPDNPVYRSQDNCLIRDNVLLKGNCNGIIPVDSEITTIYSSAYDSLKNLTSVEIPKNIISIGANAFAYCEKLTTLKIHSGINSVSSSAFYGANNLVEAELPAHCVAAISALRENNAKFTTLVINGGTVVNGTLKNFGNLTRVAMANTVTELPDGMFENCVALSELTLGSGLVKIGANAFKACAALTDVTFPNNLNEIGAEAFYQCHGITEIVIPDSVTVLGEKAFWNCQSLAKVTVGSGVKRIENETFCSLINLTELTIKDGVTEIGQMAFYYNKITTLYLPDSVTVVEKSAFQGCSYLKTVEGCNGIEELGERSFGGCANLITMSLGNKLKKIYAEAFLNNSKMKELNFDGTKAQWDSVELVTGWRKGAWNFTIKYN